MNTLGDQGRRCPAVAVASDLSQGLAQVGAGLYREQDRWRLRAHLRRPARGDSAPGKVGVLQPGTDLGGKAVMVDDARFGGRVQDDHGVHEQGLLGVGQADQVAYRRRAGVQYSQRGDLPGGQRLGQQVGIDEVPSKARRRPRGSAGQVVGCVGLQGVELGCQTATLRQARAGHSKAHPRLLERDARSRGPQPGRVFL